MDNSGENLTVHKATTNLTTSGFSAISTAEFYVAFFHFMVSLLTQFCVILFIVTRGGIASEIFILNLSVCEITFSLTSLLCLLIEDVMFTLLPTLSPGLAFTGRPLFQCMICVERYLAVVHPVTFLKSKPLRYRLICCAVAWMIIICSCLFCMLCLMAKSFYIYSWFFSVEFLFLLSVQLFCCLAVLRALKQSGPGERREREAENPIKKRAFCIIVITTVSMVIMQVPYTVSGVFTALKRGSFPDHWVVSFICFMLAGLVQPFLYLLRTCLSAS